MLQRGPQKAALYGYISPNSSVTPSTTVTVTLTPTTADGVDMSAAPIVAKGVAMVGSGHWKAILPAAMKPGGNFSVSVSCENCGNASAPTTGGAKGPASLINHVTFGDVYFCSGV